MPVSAIEALTQKQEKAMNTTLSLVSISACKVDVIFGGKVTIGKGWEKQSNGLMACTLNMDESDFEEVCKKCEVEKIDYCEVCA